MDFVREGASAAIRFSKIERIIDIVVIDLKASGAAAHTIEFFETASF